MNERAHEASACLRPRLGISTCLLGQPVRFDGGHKGNAFLTSGLGRYVEWVPVCPELEVGMGVPREPVQLVQIAGETHMIAVESGRDWTGVMNRYAHRRGEELAGEDLCGYVLKNHSPSCGMGHVKLYCADLQSPTRQGRGLFAAALLERYPALPVEEAERLGNPVSREHFVERIFAEHRLRAFFRLEWSVAGLVEFHVAHELQLMAHSAAGATALGRLVAASQGHPLREIKREYERKFTEILRRPTTRVRHIRVLLYLSEYFKEHLKSEARQDLAAAIEAYRLGQIPLIVPVMQGSRIAELHGVEWLQRQTYLNPYPEGLELRNVL